MKTIFVKLQAWRAHPYLCLMGVLFLLAGCRVPTSTPFPAATTLPQETIPTRTPFVMPTLLPTLTPRPTFTATATFTLLPTFTATATRPPATATPTNDPNATATPTATLDPVSLYEQSIPLCENAFAATSILTNTLVLTSTNVLTSTQPGTHLPVFVLLNQPDDSTLWEPVQGMEWVEAESANDVRAIACIRQARRQDATYSDQSIGYTLKWDIRLISWPDGWLIGTEAFWGEGPPLQNSIGGMVYGTPPTEQLLAWIACDLHPQPFTMLCQSGGPLAFSPDSQVLVAGEGVWDVTSGQRVAAHPAQNTTNVLALSPDGSLMASAGSGERDIQIWQASDGTILRVLSGHSGEITGLAFSPDRAWLLSSSQDGSLRVWDAQTGELLQILAENLGWLHALAISPDGTLLAAGVWSQPGLIYVWDLQAARQTGGLIQPMHTFTASEIYINALAFSPDNLLLASAGLDGNVKLWDMASAREAGAAVRLVGLLQGHADSVTCLAFSPDGKSLASGSADASVIVWDVVKGTSRRILPGAPDALVGVAYSPDGMWLAASSAGLIRLWQSP